MLPIPLTHLRPVKTIINGDGEMEDVILGTLSDIDLKAMGRASEIGKFEETQEGPSASATTAAAAPKVIEPTVKESEDQRLAREQASINRSPEQEPLPQPTPRPADGTSQKVLDEVKTRTRNENKDRTTASDTLRIDVDTQTWTPTLLRAPLPGTVIDELRGKYSVFRTRHDADYLKHLRQIDTARSKHEKWVADGGGLLDTPKREASLRAQAARKEALNKQGRVLNDQVLEGIGKMMWDRGMRLSAEEEFNAQKRFQQNYQVYRKGSGEPIATPAAWAEAPISP